MPLKYDLAAILKHQAIPGQQHFSNLDVYFLGFFFSSHLSAKIMDLAILLEDLSKLSFVRPGGLSNHFFLAPPLHPDASVALA